MKKLVLFAAFIFLTTNFVYAECPACDKNQPTCPAAALGPKIKPSATDVGMSNPAAVYCKDLGYDYKIITNEDTSQYGVCGFPDGSECEEWQFLTGKCGQKYNYCAENGYSTIVKKDGKNSFSQEYAVCVKNKKEIGSVTDLTDLTEKSTIGSFKLSAESIKSSEKITTSRDYPASFDWRNYVGQNWMTPVKAQGGCGSCWAFGSLGTVEAMYDIRKGSTYNLDLSEQQLVSSDGYCFAGGSCSGGHYDTALPYVQSNGVVDEACFPYQAGDIPCDLCSDYSSRLKYIDGTDQAIPNDIDAVKEHLYNSNGPLAVQVSIGGTGYFDANGIYRCPTISINHNVVLVGWNDALQYWIAKNSYGTGFQDGGYYKVGYGECGITTQPTAVELDFECGDLIIQNKVLSKDVVSCSGNGLLIENDGITLDCNGHAIKGTGTGNGINLNGRSNVVIKNCKIENFDKGINLVNSQNIQLIGNTFVNNNVNAYEDANSNNNLWNNELIGNYWDDFSSNPGYPINYEISGPGNGVDNKPYLLQTPVTTFSNGLSTETLTFSGSDILRYINLPKNNLAVDGTFKVTGLVSYTANPDEYQDAWESDGNFQYAASRAVDGNYDTEAICNYGEYCNVYEYYDRSPGIISAVWTFKYKTYSGSGGAKLDCWNYGTGAYQQFYSNTASGTFTRDVTLPSYCLTGDQLKIKSKLNTLNGGGFRLYESKVTWDEPMYPTNLWIEIGTVDNNPEWSYSGSFEQSNVPLADFSGSLNRALNQGACDCTGCSLNGDTCSTPVTFHSATGGLLQYSNILVNHAKPFNDSDLDGVADDIDNCPETFNPAQGDIDGDSIGDACDTADSAYQRYFFADYHDTTGANFDDVMGGGPCNQPGGCEYSQQTTDTAYCHGAYWPNYCVYQGSCYRGDGSEILDLDGTADQHEAICVGFGWWDLDSGGGDGTNTPLPGMEVCEMGGYAWAPGEAGIGEYQWNYNGYGCCGDDEGESFGGGVCNGPAKKLSPVSESSAKTKNK